MAATTRGRPLGARCGSRRRRSATTAAAERGPPAGPSGCSAVVIRSPSAVRGHPTRTDRVTTAALPASSVALTRIVARPLRA